MSLRACITCGVQKSDSNYASAFILTCDDCTLGLLRDDAGMQARVREQLDLSGGLRQPTAMYDALGSRGNRPPPGLTMPSGMTPPKPHRFGPGYDSIRTERETQHNDSVKKILLQTTQKRAEIEKAVAEDKRPLIDRLHEATFSNAPGIDHIADKYALRTMLRKAHCFTLDDVTSSLVAEFSLAIADDLESARRMAIPPFPMTWIDLNNVVRINRVKELGIPLTDQAAGKTEAGPPVERVGWLIHPADIGGFFASYCTVVREGVVMAPLSWWWHCGESKPMKDTPHDEYMHWITLGVKDPGVHAYDAYPSVTPLHAPLKKSDAKFVGEMMGEIAGELRHIWGFLIALSAGQLGVEVKTSAQPAHDDVRKMPNGKPLLPLTHKILTLHLARKMTAVKVIARSLTHHKHRWHEVRGHWRTLRNPDGSVRKRVEIPPHERGDKKLGIIEKTYKVER